ncbi:oxidoreductase [Gordonia sp. NPDC003585]|uniref:oxidoreductase n=2 Tax=unclassified Gordonia (in: high G+C Gram-positive bacteria) TaxID=2657482 RepID=UPI0033B87294
MNRILGPGRWASRRLTPHRAVLLALLLLAAAAFVVSALDADFGYEPSDLLTWIVVAVVVSGAVTYLCAFIIRVPPNSDSWLITGLILFFVLPGGSAETAVATVALGSAAAAVSKYVLVWRRRLIINPAVAGAITCYAVAYAGADDVSYPFWWVAAKPLLIPMIVIGAVLVTVLREWPLIVGYFVGALGAIGYVQLDQGGQDLELWLTSSPMIFLAAIMLPEPLTSPATRVARVVYGVLVGAVLHCQQLVEITDSYTLEFTPEIALGIGCVFAFVVRLATRSARRVPLTDIRVDPLAENIFGVQGSVSSGAPPSYAPGQWASVSVPRWNRPLWQSSRRVFSFVSASRTAPVEFGFTVAGPPSPFKQDLIDGTASRAFIDNRGGGFVLRGRLLARSPVVLVAGGIGITPFVSMLRARLDSGVDLSNLTVVHIVRSDARRVYTDVLDAAAAAGARVEVVVSADGGVPKGLLSAGAHYFVSGAPTFVSDTSSSIRRLDPSTRLRPWRIHTDTFVGY